MTVGEHGSKPAPVLDQVLGFRVTLTATLNYVSVDPYLEQPDEQHGEADGLHDAGVVVHQRLPAAPPPQVLLLALLVVVEVGGAVAELLLDAGPRGRGAAAAEGDAIHQVTPVHVTPQAAAGEEQDIRGPNYYSPVMRRAVFKSCRQALFSLLNPGRTLMLSFINPVTYDPSSLPAV